MESESKNLGDSEYRDEEIDKLFDKYEKELIKILPNEINGIAGCALTLVFTVAICQLLIRFEIPLEKYLNDFKRNYANVAAYPNLNLWLPMEKIKDEK